MSLISMIRKIIRRGGWDIIKYVPGGHPTARREKILQQYGIATVLDVGANTGQYGQGLREINYHGKIISFEPLHDAFIRLSIAAENDDSWLVHNYALGDANDKVKINIAGNSYSSSIVEMLPSHVESAPDSKYIGEQETEVTTLDSIFYTLCKQNKKVYLKLDTQGFEKNVLNGAEQSLPLVDTIQIEMSLVPLYQDELLFDEMYQYLKTLGYALVSIEPAFSDEKTGQLLQVDSIFHRF